MDYFYCEPVNIWEATLTIGGEEFIHMTHVMRKKEGDRIIVVDGRGTAYEALIEAVGRKTADCRIISKHEQFHEPEMKLTLAPAVLKNPSKFDFIVEKATELGVSEIIPLATERTIPAHAKSGRWQKLALSAMKQSGRSRLPAVRELTSLPEMLAADVWFDRKVVAHEKPPEKPPVKGAAARHGGGRESAASRVLLLIGPEGGFSDEEVERCAEKGFEILYLGERRLRSETAAIVALTLLMY